MPPKCPTCNKELIYGKMISDYREGTMYFQDWIGECECCYKLYRWTERYEYLRYMDLEEYDELD